MQTMKPQGRLHRYLDDDGQGITMERQYLPDCLVQANRYIQAGQIEEAAQWLDDMHLAQVEEHLRQQPDLTDLMYIVAKLLQDAGLKEQAVSWYQRIIEVEPHVKVLCRLSELVSIVRAAELLRQAHELDPENTDILEALARSLLRAGRVEEGLDVLQQTVARRPEARELQYGVLWHQHYLPGYDNAYFKQAYTHWAQHYYGVERTLGPHRNGRDPHRRLKLGWVSGNFKNNSIMTPFELICTLFDREAFELYGYGSVSDPNTGTQRWQTIMDVYRDVQDLDDQDAARCIYDDHIDILLEVGGHCQGNRMGIFAYQPAPLQVDYGALGTVGLPQMQYRISCPVLDPPANLVHYQEKTLYISPMCPYAPPSPCPGVTPLPARQKGTLTFGVFNNHRKVNAMSLDLWTQIMRRVPESRLVMKFPDGDDPDLVRDYLEQWERRGIDPGRIQIYGEVDLTQHLERVGQCDMMLDTFPYNAARGTMEALWMGVPTVTLAGETFVSREGLAIQSQVGLEIFAATTPDEYVAKAVSFATQWDHLEAIRLSLRQRMLQSPLCDPHGWTLKFQQVLRGIWQTWCGEKDGDR